MLKLKRAEREYQRRLAADRLSPWYILDETCRRQPHERAIWSRAGGDMTFGQLREQVLKWANWMASEGIQPGDLVAMYLHNSAEFLVIFFATMVIGAGPALINYNLEGKALMHCLAVCETKLLIVDQDEGCQARIEGSRAEIESSGAKITTLDGGLEAAVNTMPTTVPGDEWRNGLKPEFPYALIYTSGTTGLPKGCPFTISRIQLAGAHLETPFDAKRGYDCWYSPMPLYHGTGLIVSSAALLSGIAVAVTPRFSVSNFWPDIHDSRSTMFIYVGETARYLLAAPHHPLEKDHRLRLCYGNGMRADVWAKFQERFNVPSVAEFFNSSEGMFGLVVWAKSNYLRGCVGHHGLLFRRLLNNVYIPVRFDYETGDIFRDPATGFAERVPYEEGGEILVAVPNKEAFGGYWRNEEATNKRFASDVFKKGDLYYRAGDALRRSNDGHWYFLDRLGDTFRECRQTIRRRMHADLFHSRLEIGERLHSRSCPRPRRIPRHRRSQRLRRASPRPRRARGLRSPQPRRHSPGQRARLRRPAALRPRAPPAVCRARVPAHREAQLAYPQPQAEQSRPEEGGRGSGKGGQRGEGWEGGRLFDCTAGEGDV